MSQPEECSLLQEVTKLLDGKSSVTNDTAKRKSVDWVVAWDGEDARAVRHNNMFSLTRNGKPCLLKRAHRIEVVDAGNL